VPSGLTNTIFVIHFVEIFIEPSSSHHYNIIAKIIIIITPSSSPMTITIVTRYVRSGIIYTYSDVRPILSGVFTGYGRLGSGLPNV
jgi:hypothetical protein